ncbi:CoA pyrophosphatase [Rheinheimera sediminis]|uniref:CoA pyrophosphatase n=1 Tax=Rheinheimera sp. YQF-1 TaxID=2499626 RepID=UPI000FD82DFE|nr:CoA pyrophosphatase [Rheinheimera sp. YQF-1]RVT42806.1 CoA pyrophosphatase [Rheinheimera sp. YQF-1]
MNRQQFLQRFSLQAAKHSALLQLEKSKAAAVLLVLREHQGELHLLLTKRSADLRHHPGQISFPGGKIESNELSHQAALRETYEETGIAPEQLQLIGQLPRYVTGTGFLIQPWIAFLTEEVELQLQPSEVESAFWLPLSFVIDPQNSHSQYFAMRGQAHLVHFIPYGSHLIWGATAAILNSLTLQLRF